MASVVGEEADRGIGAASKFVSSRTAPKALFACEVHRDKSLEKKLETQGIRSS